ncbi:MAG: 4-alpha-glucanotransferase [Phycisphaerales bacterium]
MNTRASGILMHITSLPGKFGIGDFGPEAFKFADFLQKSRQTYWQILPLNPPNRYIGWSPYDCLSAFAGNKMLISPEMLCKQGLLDKKDLADVPRFSQTDVEFEKVFKYKTQLLNKVFDKFQIISEKNGYEHFCRQNTYWLEDYSIFVALTEKFKTANWSKWPKIRIDEKLKAAAEKEKVLQYIFYRQWLSLKEYCNGYGIKIIGDIPIYVAYQSSDVWGHQDIFKLRNKKPMFKSGVPPDYFSKTGQLWGNPIYDWKYIKKTDYEWWMQRVSHNLKLLDVVRIDHFRGLVKFWQVPGKDKTAINGKWMPGPGEDIFKPIFKKHPHANLIVEDLGFITQDVKDLIQKLNLTNMKVLLFAFSDRIGKSAFLPHNHNQNCVVYTGTHDNNTIKGWFVNELNPEKRKNLFEYIGKRVSIKDLNWELIRLAMSSVAQTAIFPMQDILNLGPQCRMNNPAKSKGNWLWRVSQSMLNNKISDKLANFTRTYGRGYY